MGGPQTVQGRARNWGYQRSLSDGHLGPQTVGHNYPNSYMEGNSYTLTVGISMSLPSSEGPKAIVIQ